MSGLIYLVEDDPDIARLIERSLGQQGFTTRTFRGSQNLSARFDDSPRISA